LTGASKAAPAARPRSLARISGSVAHDYRALDAVLQFAHIARPVPGLDRHQRILGKTEQLASFGGAEAVAEVVRQQRAVADPLAQRRNGQHDFAQPVQQILAEAPLGHHHSQILVRGADDARVDGNLGAPADPFDHPLLDEAQQLGLQGHRHVADLVEEEGAAVGHFNLAQSLLAGAGEGALLVAEQLALEQVLGNGRAVDGDEAPVLAPAHLVQGARDHLLAAAGLAQQHHRGRGRGHPFDGAAQLQHAVVARDDARQRRRILDLQHAPVFLLHRMEHEGAFDDHAQHVGIEGFEVEVIGAHANRLERVRAIAVAG
jgi:hypothetical protein